VNERGHAPAEPDWGGLERETEPPMSTTMKP
jgi:hypothetical protein